MIAQSLPFVKGKMGTHSLDGETLEKMVASATAWLERGAPDINAINVFPVPDGDTGTNMVLTMRSALQEVRHNPSRDVSSVANSLARGALMGARGNSGVILAQFWRGIAKALEGKTRLTAKDFAHSLTEALNAAYSGIINPVEGTILTVLRDASKAAEEAAGKTDDLVAVLERAVESAEDSVARTPSLLPALREAGVVDAGGQGLYALLDGALQFLKGEAHKLQYRTPRLVAAQEQLAPKMARIPSQLEAPQGYCINFVIKGQNLSLTKIEKTLREKGESLMIGGDNSVVRVHIHAPHPSEIISQAARIGELDEIAITNMADQYREFIQMQNRRMPAVDTALVTVASGDGFLQIFASLGNVIVVPGGQTMNPSVRELLQAVQSAPSDNVILLPNNKNVTSAASQVQSLTSKRVKVIPTATIPQGIAACLAFNYTLNFEENVRIMEQAIHKVKTIAITRAVRKARINNLEIRKGQFIAILDDEDLVAAGASIEGVVLRAVDSAALAGLQVVTIYHAALTDCAQAQGIAQQIRERYHCQSEVVYGGQPHYNYIISLE